MKECLWFLYKRDEGINKFKLLYISSEHQQSNISFDTFLTNLLDEEQR